MANELFPEFVVALVETARNRMFPKCALQSVELLLSVVSKIAELISNDAGTSLTSSDRDNGGPHASNVAPRPPVSQNGVVSAHTTPTPLLSKDAGREVEIVLRDSNENLHFPFTHSADPVLRYWFPIHFGLYEIIMDSDLEVRSRALKYLFEILKIHGAQYSPEFWDVVARGVLFPIFDDLRLTRWLCGSFTVLT